MRAVLHPEELAQPLLPTASADAAEEPDGARAAVRVVASAVAAGVGSAGALGEGELCSLREAH